MLISPSFNVLIVDDDPEISDLIRSYLSDRKLRLFVANTVAEARNLINMEVPDLILLDVNLPDKNGLAYLGELRTHEHTKTTPVLMISGVINKESILLARTLGAKEYIGKPFSREVVLNKVERYLPDEKAAMRQQKHAVSNIDTERADGLLTVTFSGTINETTTEKFNSIMTEWFLNKARFDQFVFDASGLPEMSPEQTATLMELFTSVKDRRPMMVGGRNYAMLVTTGLDLSSELFINLEDVKRFLELQAEA